MVVTQLGGVLLLQDLTWMTLKLAPSGGGTIEQRHLET